MILLTVGDNHTLAAQVINQYITAGEDKQYNLLGNRAHPDNLLVSWSNLLANALSIKLNMLPAYDTNEGIVKAVDIWINSIADNLAPNEIFIIIGWNEIDNKIEEYHNILQSMDINHLFFNNKNKPIIPKAMKREYIDISYMNFIKKNKLQPVIMSDVYYGKDAHSLWYKYILKHIVKYRLI